MNPTYWFQCYMLTVKHSVGDIQCFAVTHYFVTSHSNVITFFSNE